MCPSRSDDNSLFGTVGNTGVLAQWGCRPKERHDAPNMAAAPARREAMEENGAGLRSQLGVPRAAGQGAKAVQEGLRTLQVLVPTDPRNPTKTTWGEAIVSAQGQPRVPYDLGMLGKSLFSKQNSLRRLRTLAIEGRPTTQTMLRRRRIAPPAARVLELAARERYARCVQCLI